MKVTKLTNLIKMAIEPDSSVSEVVVVPEPNFPAKPEQFIGRTDQVRAFDEALRFSALTETMTSFGVLGNWGIGKSSLLLKLADLFRRGWVRARLLSTRPNSSSEAIAEILPHCAPDRAQW